MNPAYLMEDTNIGFYVKICKLSFVVFILLECLLFDCVGFNYFNTIRFEAFSFCWVLKLFTFLFIIILQNKKTILNFMLF